MGFFLASLFFCFLDEEKFNAVVESKGKQAVKV